LQLQKLSLQGGVKMKLVLKILAVVALVVVAVFAGGVFLLTAGLMKEARL